MSDKVLIITDNIRAKWLKNISTLATKNKYDISILTLGFTSEHFSICNKDNLRLLNNYKFVNIDEVSSGVQTSVRKFYIDFIFQIPTKVDKDILFCGNKNLWWLLYISVKCPFESEIINRLFYLGLTKAVMGEGQFKKVYIAIDDYVVRQTILDWKSDIVPLNEKIFSKIKYIIFHSTLHLSVRYIKNCYSFFLVNLLRAFSLKLAGILPSYTSSKKGVFIFTNYPSWWHRPYSSMPEEKFFGPLYKNLSQKYKTSYALLLFSLNPLAIFLKRKYLKRFFKENNAVLLDMQLNIRQKAVILSFRYLKWALKFRNYFKKAFKPIFEGFNIAKVLDDEIYYSLSKIGLHKNILIEDIFSKFTGNFSPKILIYRLEFNSFEKAILNGINRRCPTLTFQHSTLSVNLISHFFAEGEIEFHLKDSSGLAMPLPDFIFTTGEYYYNIMCKYGFPREQIYICGPMRFNNLLSYLRQDKEKDALRQELGFSKSDKIFLVVMNWIEREGLSLIVSLIKSQTQIYDKSTIFLLRNHPHMRYDKNISRLLKSLKPHFRYMVIDDKILLYDAISISDAVIQVPSTLGYEALAIGRMPITYENLHCFNVNSSEGLKGHAFILNSSGAFNYAVNSVVQNQDNVKEMINRWPEAMKNFFYDLKSDPYLRFIDLIEDHVFTNN